MLWFRMGKMAYRMMVTKNDTLSSCQPRGVATLRDARTHVDNVISSSIWALEMTKERRSAVDHVT